MQLGRNDLERLKHGASERCSHKCFRFNDTFYNDTTSNELISYAYEGCECQDWLCKHIMPKECRRNDYVECPCLNMDKELLWERVYNMIETKHTID